MKENLYHFLWQNAQNHADKVAVFVEKKKLTFKKLLHESDRVAAFLHKEGVQVGDKVALILSNSWEYVAALFGIFRLGAIAVPMNTMLKNDEMEYILKDSGASLAFISGKFYKEAKNLLYTTGLKKVIWHESDTKNDARNLHYHEIPSVFSVPQEWAKGGEETAVIIYTSGTTGFPKGAMLTHKNFISNLTVITERFRVLRSDRFIVYLPIFHAFTLTATILLPMYHACSVVIVRSIMPFSNILKQVLFKRVTIFLGVPDVYSALIRAKLPWYFMWFNRVRIFVSGASALSTTTLERFKEKFKKAVMLEGYGLSECSPAVAVNSLERQKASSVGRPLAGYEVKIVNDELVELPTGEAGEIIVRGDCVMKGYLNHYEATESAIVNGWLLTGDIGRVDEEGYLYIMDRKKDLIISKGINIYPREIEEMIMGGFPAVKSCAVVGWQDDSLDEIPVAFLEYEEGITPYSELEIKGYLKKHLANFKIPKHIYARSELPKNATGKVLKRVLKEELQNARL